MPESIIHIAESLSIEDGTVHIEQYRVPVTATYEEAKTALREQNAEITLSPAKMGSADLIRIVGYDGYYYLKFANGPHLSQLGAKEGNGTDKGHHHL